MRERRGEPYLEHYRVNLPLRQVLRDGQLLIERVQLHDPLVQIVFHEFLRHVPSKLSQTRRTVLFFDHRVQLTLESHCGYARRVDGRGHHMGDGFLHPIGVVLPVVRRSHRWPIWFLRPIDCHSFRLGARGCRVRKERGIVFIWIFLHVLVLPIPPKFFKLVLR